LRPADAEPLAVLAEERADVCRQVREEVARILVLGDPPARQLRLEAIDRPAAIAVDQTAQELLRVAVDDLPLPIREHDPAQVLAARTGLRKHSIPALTV